MRVKLAKNVQMEWSIRQSGCKRCFRNGHILIGDSAAILRRRSEFSRCEHGQQCLMTSGVGSLRSSDGFRRQNPSCTSDASGLAAVRAGFPNPKDHIILPEIISKEPLGPLVRHGDAEWEDVIRWTLNALVATEELGVTSANIAEMIGGTDNPEINRMLGTEGNLGEMLNLDAEWAQRAIMAGGNYGELFEANIGASTTIGLERGLNDQWNAGGLMYAPPFR